MSKILFIFEGEKTEKQITNNLKKFFISENSVIECAYCSNIYKLYKEISEDEDLDTFQLLKEIPQNKEILETYNRKDFAEIYMFFDYDGHDNLADDKKVIEIIDFFNEETETGKIYISYPMVESLKHYSDLIDFKELKVSAKHNIKYKNLVDNEAQNELKHFSKYSMQIWKSLIDLHLRKANYITNNYYTIPLKDGIKQNAIFINQLDKYLKVDSTVAVLSSFPAFLFEYYGYDYICNFLTEE
ncbi:MAG: hypothetical protein JEZ09_16390 [Salinivirgaceae bacterium]|nr:hypothetical protein [Salinivirgaceae bacterium]